jgi:hypothetical protein
VRVDYVVALSRSEARRVLSRWVKWVRSVEAMGLVKERGGGGGTWCMRRVGLVHGIGVWVGRCCLS